MAAGGQRCIPALGGAPVIAMNVRGIACAVPASESVLYRNDTGSSAGGNGDAHTSEPEGAPTGPDGEVGGGPGGAGNGTGSAEPGGGR